MSVITPAVSSNLTTNPLLVYIVGEEGEHHSSAKHIQYLECLKCWFSAENSFKL